MADTLNQEIRTTLTGDSSNLVSEMGKAGKAVDGFTKKQKEADKALAGSMDKVRAFFSSPVSAAGKGFDKIGSSLGLSSRAAGALGAGVGAAAVAGGILVRTFTAAADLARQQADSMSSLAEQMRRTSRTNLFATSADGFESLSSKLASERENLSQSKLLREQFNPYGFGGGVSGTMKTVASNAQLALKDSVGLGPYNSFDRAKDASKILEGEEKLANQRAARLAGLAGQSLVNRVDITREQTSGSGEQAAIKSLAMGRRVELGLMKGTELNTPENRRAVRGRYKTQIATEREAEDARNRRVQVSAQNQGITANGSLTDEAKRVTITDRNLSLTRELLRTRTHLTEEARQSLELERGSLDTELKLAKADVTVSESQNKLGRELATIRGSASTLAAKEYSSALATGRALETQRAALKGVNETRARGLEITLAENQAVVQQMRQDTLMGKSPAAVNRMMYDRQRHETAVKKFRDKDDRTDGLLSPEKDMSGNIISGIDPLTGRRRAPSPGKGRAEQGLHSGGLETGSLSTSGTTGAMFGRTSAAAALDRAPSAANALAGLTDTAAARLDRGTIFPDLHRTATHSALGKEGHAWIKKMREGSGLHTGGLTTGSLHGGATALAHRDGSTETPAHKAMTGMASAIAAGNGLGASTNQLLGGILAALTNMQFQ